MNNHFEIDSCGPDTCEFPVFVVNECLLDNKYLEISGVAALSINAVAEGRGSMQDK